MIDLLPCPFCGGSDIRVNGSRSSFVQCGGCGAESRAEDDDRAAIAAWNGRADDWQPIATAPRDGTEVLIRCSCTGMWVVSWVVDVSREWMGWCVDDGKSDPYPLRGRQPTHWRPLPEGPTV